MCSRSGVVNDHFRSYSIHVIVSLHPPVANLERFLLLNAHLLLLCVDEHPLVTAVGVNDCGRRCDVRCPRLARLGRRLLRDRLQDNELVAIRPSHSEN